MRGHGCTGDPSDARDNVNNSRREPSFLDEVGENKTREGGLFGSLQDNCVTSSKGGGNLPRQHKEWEVPGNDLGADANLRPVRNSMRS